MFWVISPKLGKSLSHYSLSRTSKLSLIFKTYFITHSYFSSHDFEGDFNLYLWPFLFQIAWSAYSLRFRILENLLPAFDKPAGSLVTKIKPHQYVCLDVTKVKPHQYVCLDVTKVKPHQYVSFFFFYDHFPSFIQWQLQSEESSYTSLTSVYSCFYLKALTRKLWI